MSPSRELIIKIAHEEAARTYYPMKVAVLVLFNSDISRTRRREVIINCRAGLINENAIRIAAVKNAAVMLTMAVHLSYCR